MPSRPKTTTVTRMLSGRNDNDLEDLGLLKVDVLGLGMLTAIRRSFDLIRDFDGREYTLATVPAEDPEVYRHDLRR